MQNALIPFLTILAFASCSPPTQVRQITACIATRWQVYQDCTMDEMMEFCSQFVEVVNTNMSKPMTKDEYKGIIRQYSPTLKRWKQ